MSDVITILCTCPNAEEADRISRALLEARLVACAQAFPAGSTQYWWKGKIERANEVYVLFKTRAGKYIVVERMIKQMHSYQMPCIVAYDIKEGSAPFLNWVRGETF